ncbi:MAG TPA: tautomerase family protein [Intrasporangium sp.]|nr:tautomerase family protein [Intrasporangium sp.]
MPVAHLHVVDPTPEQRRRLGDEATRIYAEALKSPIDRIRVYVVSHRRDEVTVGGVSAADGGLPAPFFTAVVLAGRPVEQRHKIMRRLSALLAEVMGVEIAAVRGRIIRCEPEDWAIAGEPASVVRASEIAARSQLAG